METGFHCRESFFRFEVCNNFGDIRSFGFFKVDMIELLEFKILILINLKCFLKKDNVDACHPKINPLNILELKSISLIIKDDFSSTCSCSYPKEEASSLNFCLSFFLCFQVFQIQLPQEISSDSDKDNELDFKVNYYYFNGFSQVWHFFFALLFQKEYHSFIDQTLGLRIYCSGRYFLSNSCFNDLNLKQVYRR